MSYSDEQFMQRCLQLAALGEYYVAPNPMVGAVIVSADGRIIGEGWHRRYGGPHAEVNAFSSVKPKDEPLLSEATIYVSLEPCSHFGKTPPCADLIVRKGVKRVVIACLDPNPLVAGNGVRKLREAGIEVESGIMENEARQLNKRFFCLHEKHRPYIILKWAQSADGFIAPLNQQRGERVVFSTPQTKLLVHKMRAENMAILVGVNTIISDNPRLLTTHWQGRNPLRIVLDSHNRIPKDAIVLTDSNLTWVITGDTKWESAVKQMAERNIHSVLVEGGAKVLQSVLQSGIYDELHIEINPKVYLKEGIKAPAVDTLNFDFEELDGNKLLKFTKI